MIRVLAVMDSTGGGGAETSMAAMAPLMRGEGVELEVAFFHDRDGVKDSLRSANVPLWQVSPGRTRVSTVNRLRHLIRDRRPDLIHTMVFEADIIGRAAAFLAGVPAISSIISDIYGPEFMSAAASRRKARLAQALDALTAQTIHGFHAVSMHTATHVPSRLGARRKPTTVIYRGRDLTRFSTLESDDRSRVREELGIPSDEKMLILVARHERPKGIDTAIEALAHDHDHLQRAHLVVAGRRGEQSAYLERTIRALGLQSRVHLIGQRSDVARIIGASDIALCPSSWEGFPGAALESRLCGIPLVASDIPPLRELAEVTEPAAVVFFRPGDARDLALRLSRALNTDYSSAERSTMEWREYFGLERAALEFADLYRSASNGRRRKGATCGQDIA